MKAHVPGMLVRMGGKISNYVQLHFHDEYHRVLATKIVHTMHELNGQTLTPKMKKSADDYSVEVFGSKRYALWLYVYALVRGQFVEGWLPDNFFQRFVMPHINKQLRHMTDYKSFSNVVLRTTALPDIGYFIDGHLYDRELSIVGLDDFRKMISSHQTLFVKEDNSGGEGRGVRKFTSEELTEDSLRKIGNCVIQAPIKQHPFFDEMISSSVATIRITTVKDTAGKIDIRGAFLRLGRKHTAWVQANDSIKVAVINGSGDLDRFGYDPDWKRLMCHPDSGIIFWNRRIPNFQQAVEACIELHNKLPHFTIIGWDVAVDQDEQVQLMEWNGDGVDIKFAEATTGPWFSDLRWEKYKQR
jgi:hypothetical protein